MSQWPPEKHAVRAHVPLSLQLMKRILVVMACAIPDSTGPAY
jgi:hypothetical protein